MTASKKTPSPVPKGEDLHAGDLPESEDRRKREAEADVVESVAGVMAGEVIAAVTGKARKRKP